MHGRKKAIALVLGLAAFHLPSAVAETGAASPVWIAFGPDDEASPVRVKRPQVFEQFDCWRPMEGHTANAIRHEQYADGQFSTWGRDYQMGKSMADEVDPPRHNWYNGNAFADWALYRLTLYCRTLPQ